MFQHVTLCKNINKILWLDDRENVKHNQLVYWFIYISASSNKKTDLTKPLLYKIESKSKYYLYRDLHLANLYFKRNFLSKEMIISKLSLISKLSSSTSWKKYWFLDFWIFEFWLDCRSEWTCLCKVPSFLNLQPVLSF